MGLVGTEAEELESVKELIRFDHVYYKPNQATKAKSVVKIRPASPVVKTGQSIVKVNPAPSVVKVRPSPNVNILVKQEKPCNVNISSPQDNAMVAQVVCESPVDSEPIVIPDTDTEQNSAGEDVPADIVNEAVNEDNFDIDNFLEFLTGDLASMEAESGDSGALDTVNSKEEPPTKKQKVVPSVSAVDTIADTKMPLDIGVPPPHSPLSTGSGSESGYSSDYGDALSPHSDLSSPLNNAEWEESFTQLFPSLF